ncbi:NrfD/PsrC family molybdoenzyme membrane anchor subunit [Streptomyces sp. S465]|uniref:NrfD/PsrC family molybdoenzyme membrane anchor subunit n=1 Tax=Streptomyces sp. S465 TaxID=2979468 RepID=UPI0022A86636|nr:NrfD/PsrC family molybdoenzyme membrane anchor subunit [Streptomyces sp. S465]WAP54031.1 polysulfide reductase NrfD [Streptomyces sp. S465]
MSESDVTRDGVRGERPGRDALVGRGMGDGERPDGKRRGRKGGTGRRGDQPMVPRAEFTSYYGRPVLNPPTWQPRDIAGYFFLGGLAGAGSVLAAGAELTGRPGMARALKVSSLAALTGSTAALIHDLGRPGRFAHMLRVFKPTSPMSVGSWLLAAYGPVAGAALASDLTGRLPRAGRAATVAAALLGPAVASYTAVLAADTAVPAWHDGYRELPYLFVGSAATAAGGMALLASPVAENAPARGVALLGTAVETAAVKAMERRLGVVAETYREGRAGRLMRTAEALSAAGALGGALLGRRSRTAAALSGAALLAASACTRFGVFHAGMRSAKDPKYTVLPQRERLEARRERPQEG